MQKQEKAKEIRQLICKSPLRTEKRRGQKDKNELSP